MKINKSILILISFPAFMLFHSCDNDLELLPQDSLTPEAFYANPENFPAALNGVYDALQTSGMYSLMALFDGVTDNAVAQFNSISDFVDYGRGQSSANVNNNIVDLYQDPFIVIQRANFLLANIDNEGAIQAEERNAIRAEAQALRALAYMRLTYLFGEVPLITTPISREEILQLNRTSRTDLVNFILDEFGSAANVLGASPFNGEEGRFTKQAALGFRAKVLLYEARLGNANWSEARSAVNEAIVAAETAGAGLLSVGDGTDGQLNYAAIFFESNEGNEEALFTVKFDELDRGGDYYNRFGVQAGTLYMTVLENLVDDYYTTDGFAITDANSNYDPANPYANRDPRLEATIIVPGALFSNGGSLEELTPTSNPVAFTSFFLRKQITLEGEIAWNDQGLVDAIVLRYADLLLMLAEAENEVNGPTATAYDAINQIRARVNMPDVTPALSQDEFREEVIHERRVELAFEQQRWFDLMTLGIADEKINGINQFDLSFLPNKQELFPIPQTEIDLNPNLTQNQGY
ncbi:MAG: RagB/SusD family nutrient uptake outer membrane protein [Bacteroidota bacterium]